jgi:hypothetical protein
MTTKNFNVKNGLSINGVEVIDSSANANFASLTVNGLPVGYDQSLNTTDNAQFNNLKVKYHKETTFHELVSSSYNGVDEYFLANVYPWSFNLYFMKQNNTWSKAVENISAGQNVTYTYTKDGVVYTLNTVVTSFEFNGGPTPQESSSGTMYFSTTNGTYTDSNGNSGTLTDFFADSNHQAGGWDWPWSPAVYSQISYDLVTINVDEGTVLNADDQGTSIPNLLSTEIITDAALIGNMVMMENTIEPTDAYGLPDKLTVNGSLEVTGELISPVTLTLNADKSKSVVVDTRKTIDYEGTDDSNLDKIYWQDASWYNQENMPGMNRDGKTIRFSYLNTYTLDLLKTLQSGDKITLHASNGWGVIPYKLTFVSLTPGDVDIWNLKVEEVNQAYMSILFQRLYGITIDSGVVKYFTFDEHGTLTTEDLIADAALIGNMVMMENTITPTDAYGLPDTLTVDGTLSANTIKSENVSVGTIVPGTFTSLSNDGTPWMFMNNYAQGPETILNYLEIGGTNAGRDYLNSLSVGDTLSVDVEDNWNGNGKYSAYGTVTSINKTYYDMHKMQQVTIVNVNDWTYTKGNEFNLGTVESRDGPSAGSPSILTVHTLVSGTPTTIDSDGINTLNVITDAALIGNMVMVDNTITPTDAYGLPDTLTVDGTLAANTAVIDNLEVPKHIEIPYTLLSGSSWSGVPFWNITNNSTYGKTVSVGGNNTARTYLKSLSVGDTINLDFNLRYMTNQDYFLSGKVISVIETSDMMSMAQITRVSVESWEVRKGTNTLSENFEWSSSSDSMNSGSKLSILIKSFGTPTTIDTDGLITSNILSDAALIGDVVIAGNSLSAIDPYGLKEELLIDGDLSINGNVSVLFDNRTSTQDTLSNMMDFSQASWKRLSDTTSKFRISLYGSSDKITSLNSGDVISWTETMSGVKYSVTLSSPFVYNQMDMRWEANTVEMADTMIGMEISISSQITLINNSGELKTPVKITKDGVDVKGTFLVNGASVGSDQSLNTTNNVQFQNLKLFYHDEYPQSTTLTASARNNNEDFVIDAYPWSFGFVIRKTMNGSSISESSKHLSVNQNVTVKFRNPNNGVIYTFNTKIENISYAMNPGDTSYVSALNRGDSVNFYLYKNNTDTTYTGSDGSSGTFDDFMDNSQRWTSGWDYVGQLPPFDTHVSYEYNYTFIDEATTLESSKQGVSIPKLTSNEAYVDNLISDAGLIGNIVIADNSIMPTDAYGMSDTLTIKGLTKFTKPTLVHVEDDCSTSLTQGSVYVALQNGIPYIMMGGQNWSGLSYDYTQIRNYLRSLKEGDRVDFSFNFTINSVAVPIRAYGIVYATVNPSNTGVEVYFSQVKLISPLDLTPTDNFADLYSISNAYGPDWVNPSHNFKVYYDVIQTKTLFEIDENGPKINNIGQVGFANNIIRGVDSTGTPTTLKAETNFSVIHSGYEYYTAGIPGWSGTNQWAPSTPLAYAGVSGGSISIFDDANASNSAFRATINEFVTKAQNSLNPHIRYSFDMYEYIDTIQNPGITPLTEPTTFTVSGSANYAENNNPAVTNIYLSSYKTEATNVELPNLPISLNDLDVINIAWNYGDSFDMYIPLFNNGSGTTYTKNQAFADQLRALFLNNGCTLSFTLTVNGTQHTFNNVGVQSTNFYNGSYIIGFYDGTHTLVDIFNGSYWLNSNVDFSDFSITNIDVTNRQPFNMIVGANSNFKLNFYDNPYEYTILGTTEKGATLTGTFNLNGNFKINGEQLNKLGNDRCVIVYGTGTPEQNGVELKSALTKAEQLANQLAYTNNWNPYYSDANQRVNVIVSPGEYQAVSNTSFTITNYVNVQSLTGNCDVHIYNPAGRALYVDGGHIKGIKSNLIQFGDWGYSPLTAENCISTDDYSFNSLSLSSGLQGQLYVNFKNCTGGYYSFIGDVVSGVFENCIGGYESFKANFIFYAVAKNCQVQSGFNSQGYFSGHFENCTSTTGPSFTGTTSVWDNQFVAINCKVTSGTGNFLSNMTDIVNPSLVYMENCTSSGMSFLYNIGNYGVYDTRFINCSSGDYSFGSDTRMSGWMVARNCTAGSNSFAGRHNNSGIVSAALNGEFTNCQAGNYSFGYNYDYGISGKFTNCQAGTYSFGTVSNPDITNGNPGGIQSGQFINCIADSFSFATNTPGGIGQYATLIGCKAEGYSFASLDPILVNTSVDPIYGGVSGTLIDCTASDYSFGTNTSNGVNQYAVLKNCQGGSYSFGSLSTYYVRASYPTGFGGCHGLLNNCRAGDYSFGANSGAGTQNGTFEYCTSGISSFGWYNDGSVDVGNSLNATYRYCIGGFGSGADAAEVKYCSNINGWITSPPTGANYAFWN